MTQAKQHSLYGLHLLICKMKGLVNMISRDPYVSKIFITSWCLRIE